MNESFRLRRATADDSRRAFDVFLVAIRDFAARINQPWEVEPDAQWSKMRDLFAYLGEHAAEWWLAEDARSGEPIGYARSVQRGSLLELSEFFAWSRSTRSSCPIDRSGGSTATSASRRPSSSECSGWS